MNPDKKIRRLQSLLYTSGMGTILFSVWSVLRGIGGVYKMLREMPQNGGENIGGENISGETLMIVSAIVIVLMIVMILWLYIYIGRRAMQTSLGIKTSNKYIILAILDLAFAAVVYISELVTQQPSEWLDDIMLTIIDVTSDVILLEVVVFSILLKKLR